MALATHGGLGALLGIGPAAVTEVVRLAERDLHQGNAVAALEAAETACQLSPARADAWLVRARACGRLGRLAEADTYEEMSQRLKERT